MRSKIVRAAAIVVATMVGSVVVAGPATACSFGSGCQFYNSNRAGGVYEHWTGDSSFANDTFSTGTTTSGVGQSVNDNAASAYNGTNYARYRTFKNYNYAGDSQTVDILSWENFNSPLKNENSSATWVALVG